MGAHKKNAAEMVTRATAEPRRYSSTLWPIFSTHLGNFTRNKRINQQINLYYHWRCNEVAMCTRAQVQIR